MVTPETVELDPETDVEFDPPVGATTTLVEVVEAVSGVEYTTGIVVLADGSTEDISRVVDTSAVEDTAAVETTTTEDEELDSAAVDVTTAVVVAEGPGIVTPTDEHSF